MLGLEDGGDLGLEFGHGFEDVAEGVAIFFCQLSIAGFYLFFVVLLVETESGVVMSYLFEFLPKL